ncbi:MAG: hypothetical protein EPN74_04775 [Rhodanobacter sp.]|nr:MAG: hypothetical protein EPN74_04775 [Rhodanobacter sp.]
MKKPWMLWAICGAFLMCSTVAAVARPVGQDDQGQNDHQDHHDRGRHHQDQGRDHQDRGRGHDRQDRQDRNYRAGREDHHPMYERGRREGWYRRGGRVPSEYRGGSYVVNDWQREHLSRPRRGYHWVRGDNGDFLLVAISTGVILNILLHH